MRRGIKFAEIEIAGGYGVRIAQAEKGACTGWCAISPFDRSRAANVVRSVSSIRKWDDEIRKSKSRRRPRHRMFRASGKGGQHVNRRRRGTHYAPAPRNIVSYFPFFSPFFFLWFFFFFFFFPFFFFFFFFFPSHAQQKRSQGRTRPTSIEDAIKRGCTSARSRGADHEEGGSGQAEAWTSRGVIRSARDVSKRDHGMATITGPSSSERRLQVMDGDPILIEAF